VSRNELAHYVQAVKIQRSVPVHRSEICQKLPGFRGELDQARGRAVKAGVSRVRQDEVG